MHHRKRISLRKNFETLEFARSMGIIVTIHIIIIADPTWDRERFATVNQWCLEVPEIVNISINTPIPEPKPGGRNPVVVKRGNTAPYDIQYAILPTTFPLPEFL